MNHKPNIQARTATKTPQIKPKVQNSQNPKHTLDQKTQPKPKLTEILPYTKPNTKTPLKINFNHPKTTIIKFRNFSTAQTECNQPPNQPNSKKH